MNNKIYWAQTMTSTGKRHCFIVSAPHLSNVIEEIQDNWCDDDEEIIDCTKCDGVFDIDPDNEGKTVIKMHN